MKSITFSVPIEPIGKERPRFNSKMRRTYTPAKTKEFESIVRLYCRTAMARENFKPFAETALAATVICGCVPPDSWTNSRKENAIHGHIRKITKPDVDNLAKAALDALNGVLYDDDSRIIELHTIKIYLPNP